MNKCSGVIGVFNCQGAGWCKITKKTCIHDESPGTLTGSVRATDVDAIAQVAGADWNGETIVYAYKSGIRIIYLFFFSFRSKLKFKCKENNFRSRRPLGFVLIKLLMKDQLQL